MTTEVLSQHVINLRGYFLTEPFSTRFLARAAQRERKDRLDSVPTVRFSELLAIKRRYRQWIKNHVSRESSANGVCKGLQERDNVGVRQRAKSEHFFSC